MALSSKSLCTPALHCHLMVVDISAFYYCTTNIVAHMRNILMDKKRKEIFLLIENEAIIWDKNNPRQKVVVEAV